MSVLRVYVGLDKKYKMLLTRKHDPVYRKDKHIEEHGEDSESPKPRETCPWCSEPIFLKWGKIRVDPYWSHYAGKNGCNWDPEEELKKRGETKEHLQAKEKIARILGSSGLIVSTRCTICRNTSEDAMPRLFYQCEVRHESAHGACTWDVAGTRDGAVEIGIEVWHTHETTTLLPRSSVWWAEFRTEDVAAIKETGVAERIDNVRSDQICMGNPLCAEKVKEMLLTKQRERERIKQEEVEKKRVFEEERKKRANIAEELGFLSPSGVYTDIVDLSFKSGGVGKRLADIPECLSCGELKNASFRHVAYCNDCRGDVNVVDKARITKMCSQLGLLIEGKWKIADTLPRDCVDLNAIHGSGKCAKCLRRTRSQGGYGAFPFCLACTSEITNNNSAKTVDSCKVQEQHRVIAVVPVQQEPVQATVTTKSTSKADINRFKSSFHQAPAASAAKKKKEVVRVAYRNTTNPANPPGPAPPALVEPHAPAGSAHGKSEADIIEILEKFDGSGEYGPRLGITRLARWERAFRFELNPPQIVKAILTADLRNSPPRHQMCNLK